MTCWPMDRARRSHPCAPPAWPWSPARAARARHRQPRWPRAGLRAPPYATDALDGDLVHTVDDVGGRYNPPIAGDQNPGARLAETGDSSGTDVAPLGPYDDDRRADLAKISSRLWARAAATNAGTMAAATITARIVFNDHPALQARVEQVAQPVAQHVEAEDGERSRPPARSPATAPGTCGPDPPATASHPRSGTAAAPQAQERQARLGEDHRRESGGRDHDDRGHRVGQEVTRGDAEMARAHGARALDEGVLLVQRDATDDARVLDAEGHAEHDRDVQRPGPDQRRSTSAAAAAETPSMRPRRVGPEVQRPPKYADSIPIVVASALPRARRRTPRRATCARRDEPGEEIAAELIGAEPVRAVHGDEALPQLVFANPYGDSTSAKTAPPS